MAALRRSPSLSAANPVERWGPTDVRVSMLKNFSLSILFFLALGLVVAAYATIPV